MYKWLAAVTVLLSTFGYGGNQIEWLHLGDKMAERIGHSQIGKLGDLLPQLIEKNSGDKNNRLSKREYAARVIRVADGDTLTVIDDDGQKHKIRMAYIDAPELQQAYGTHSRDALLNLVDTKRVDIQVFGLDRYRREVAKVTLNHQDINLAQIKQGAAWHYERYAQAQQNRSDYVSYAQAHQTAEKNRQGLWKKANAQAPWEYRKAQRENEEQKQNGLKNTQEWLKIW